MTQLFTGIEHIAVASSHPERLARWYVTVLQARIQATLDNDAGKPPAQLVRLGANGPLLEIVNGPPGESGGTSGQTGLVHLAVTVADFDAAMRQLAEFGVCPEGPELAGAFDSRVRFYRDPEGNLFHLLFRPQPLPE